MNFVKTGLLNSLATLIKMIVMLGVNKLIALYLGPSGYALIGNFQNLIQIVITFSSTCFTSGVVKYTAEYNSDTRLRSSLWKTSFIITLILSVLIGLTLLLSKDLIPKSIVGVDSIIYLLSFSIVFISLNGLMLAVINGLKDIKRFFWSTVIANILGFFIFLYLVISFGSLGALVGIILHQACGFFVTGIILYKADDFALCFRSSFFSKSIATKLLRYALSMLVTAVLYNIVMVLVRDHISEHVGIKYAGYWEAMSRLSSAYLLLFTSLLSFYFVPKISEIKDALKIKLEIYSVLKILMPIVFIFCAIVYFVRELMISLLFSKEFQPAGELFLFYLLGDFFKIAAWVFSFVMLGRAMLKSYVFVEVCSSMFFYFLIKLLVNESSFSAVSVSYFITYMLYFVLSCSIVMFKLKARCRTLNL